MKIQLSSYLYFLYSNTSKIMSMNYHVTLTTHKTFDTHIKKRGTKCDTEMPAGYPALVRRCAEECKCVQHWFSAKIKMTILISTMVSTLKLIQFFYVVVSKYNEQCKFIYFIKITINTTTCTIFIYYLNYIPLRLHFCMWN